MCLFCSNSNIQQTIYCERGNSTALLSEPINAFTNLLFIILGMRAFSWLKKEGITDKSLLILPYLLSTIGVGSFLYHTARSTTTLLLDAIPIYIFIAYSLFLAFLSLTGKKIQSFIIVVTFIVTQVVLSVYVPKEFMNGSIRHIITILFLLLVGIALYKKFGRSVVKKLGWVIGFYALAIFFRSIDATVCNYLPFGTHFLWHVFAALAGYKAIFLVASISKSK